MDNESGCEDWTGSLVFLGQCSNDPIDILLMSWEEGRNNTFN